METNYAELVGTVWSEPVFSHKSYGEAFYEVAIGVSRKSQYVDEIPVVVSERLFLEGMPQEGDRVRVKGQVRTYNKEEDGKNRLIITVFARSYESEEDAYFDENTIRLDGFVCKRPVHRTSPLGREICDLMIAVNRMYNKSDYIPCIAWGRNAGYAENLEVGEKIQMMGRIQSREYRKKEEDGDFRVKVAYEVSILKIEGEKEE